MALTDKQAIFVENYLVSFNATKAARAAGYSPKTAYSIGHAILRKPEIAEAVKQRLSEAAMSADEVLMLLSEQANAAYSDYITERGTIDVKRIVQDGKARLIKSIKYTESGKKNIEFYDAHAALVQLGRHHKLFTDQLEAAIDVGLDDTERATKLAALFNRARARRDGQTPESGQTPVETASGAAK